MKTQHYDSADLDSCLQLFDENCPRYFAENEKEDYIAFLTGNPSDYFVMVKDAHIVAAFGVLADLASFRGRLSWILVSPRYQGMGMGTHMMESVRNIAIKKELPMIDIAASHLSAPFFEKFGAQVLQETINGWGEGMHRVDMQLEIRA